MSQYSAGFIALSAQAKACRNNASAASLARANTVSICAWFASLAHANTAEIAQRFGRLAHANVSQYSALICVDSGA